MSLGLRLGIPALQGGGFSPAALFAGGEAGAWYEPGPTTCFTDAARTTPAGNGDPVGGMLDLSGNGSHMSQSTAAARPTLTLSGGLWYLTTDGIDDWMLAAVGIAAEAAWESVWASTRGTTAAYYWSYAGVSTAARNGAAVELRWQNSVGSFVKIGDLPTAGACVMGASSAAVGSNDLTGYVNGTTGATITRATTATGGDLAIGNGRTDIFSAGQAFNFYGGVWVDRQLTAGERAATTEHFAGLSGVTL